MKRCYDPNHSRLVYIGSLADKGFWDEHWAATNVSTLYKPKVPPFNYVVNITKKYLPSSSIILEGGAGLAQNSWYLHLSGYRTIALDFAPKTINFLKRHRPELHPMLGDVRNLPLEDESIDGYWSLGVIEHFYDGYGAILSEMHRVIKRDGYLFLTFPHMSKLRQIKARKGLYEIWPGNGDLVADFYQFALDPGEVKRKFERYGFKCISAVTRSGVKGLKDEVPMLKPFLQKVFDGENLFFKSFNHLLNPLLSPLAGHMRFMALQKM